MCGHCVHGAPAIMCTKNETKIINKHIHGTTLAIRRGNSLWVIFPYAFRLFFHCATLPPPPSLPRCQSHSATTFLLPGLFTIAAAAAPLTAQCAQRQTCRRPQNPATYVILESNRTSVDRYAMNAMILSDDFTTKSISIGRIFEIRQRERIATRRQF